MPYDGNISYACFWAPNPVFKGLKDTEDDIKIKEQMNELRKVRAEKGYLTYMDICLILKLPLLDPANKYCLYCGDIDIWRKALEKKQKELKNLMLSLEGYEDLVDSSLLNVELHSIEDALSEE